METTPHQRYAPQEVRNWHKHYIWVVLYLRKQCCIIIIMSTFTKKKENDEHAKNSMAAWLHATYAVWKECSTRDMELTPKSSASLSWLVLEQPCKSSVFVPYKKKNNTVSSYNNFHEGSLHTCTYYIILTAKEAQRQRRLCTRHSMS